MSEWDGVESAAKSSTLWAKYGTRLERESAAEALAKRAATDSSAATPEEHARKRAPDAKKPTDALTDFLGSRQGKALQRELVRGAFSLLRKRL